MAKEKRERSGLILELTVEGLDAHQVAELLGCCTRTVERALEDMFEGAADRATVVLELPDEDVSDAEMQALVEACTLTAPTDPSRYLSEGYALQGEPAPAATPETVPAWIEADPAPYLSDDYREYAVKFPLPGGQSVSDHADRLFVLYRHFLANPTHTGRFWPCMAPRQSMLFAFYSLAQEVESGKLTPGVLKAQRPKAKRAPRRQVRSLGHCPSPATHLH